MVRVKYGDEVLLEIQQKEGRELPPAVREKLSADLTTRFERDFEAMFRAAEREVPTQENDPK